VLRNTPRHAGYCIAVFAAGYVTANSEVRGNLCIDNALSPRSPPCQGAVYVIPGMAAWFRGLRHEQTLFSGIARSRRCCHRERRANRWPSCRLLSKPRRVGISRRIIESTSSGLPPQHLRHGGEPVVTSRPARRHSLRFASAGSETGSSCSPPRSPRTKPRCKFDAAYRPTPIAMACPARAARGNSWCCAAWPANTMPTACRYRTFSAGKQNDAVANGCRIAKVCTRRIAFRARRSYRRSGVSRWHHSSRIRRRTAAGEWPGFRMPQPLAAPYASARAARLLSHAKTRGRMEVSNDVESVHGKFIASELPAGFVRSQLCAALIAAACAASCAK